MYPGMMYRWKRGRASCESRCESHAAEGSHHHHHDGWRRRHERRHDDELFEAAGPPSGAFGVRRPLRFMAHKLDLTEEQIKQVAEVLSDLKTERAQAEVDDRRTVNALASALDAADFDEAKAKAGLDRRVASAEQLRDAVLSALRRIHAVLDEEQREKLAYLLRSGTLVV